MYKSPDADEHWQIYELHILGAAAVLRLRPSKDILQDLLMLLKIHQWFLSIQNMETNDGAKKKPEEETGWEVTLLK